MIRVCGIHATDKVLYDDCPYCTQIRLRDKDEKIEQLQAELATTRMDRLRVNWLAICRQGWPLIEAIGNCDVYYHVTYVMPDEWEPDPNDASNIPPEKMQEAFRRMIDEASGIDKLMNGED